MLHCMRFHQCGQTPAGERPCAGETEPGKGANRLGVEAWPPGRHPATARGRGRAGTRRRRRTRRRPVAAGSAWRTRRWIAAGGVGVGGVKDGGEQSGRRWDREIFTGYFSG
uniref:Uncharacterized protein n=1 Tax=Setaria italica TaxID=4555 RepID=K3XTN4_SETIT